MTMYIEEKRGKVSGKVVSWRFVLNSINARCYSILLKKKEDWKRMILCKNSKMLNLYISNVI